MGKWSRLSQAFLSGIQGKDKKHWAGTEVKENPFKHKKNLIYCEGSQTGAKHDQRSCGISVLGGNQSPTGHDAEQTAQVDPALSTGGD